MEEIIKMCPHGRDINQMCPHCLGTNETVIDKPVKKEEVEKLELPENSPLKRLVPPHTKVSRLVTEADVERVVKEAKILHAICFEQLGLYPGAFAMAEPQINNKDPLRFYVTADKKIVINPTIIRHSNYTVDSKEGCYSFPGKEQVVIQRWQKCEMNYVTIMVDEKDSTKFKLSSIIEESLSGKNSFIAQHEINHLDGIYIYDKTKE